MDGSAHWMDFAVVLGGGIAILAFVLLLGPFRARQRRFVRFDCEVRHEPVECIVACRPAGDVVDVERCSVFGKGDVTCEKRCIAQLNAHPVRHEHGAHVT